MNQLRVVKSLNGGIEALHGQHFSLYREVGSVLGMAGPGAPLLEIAKYFGRLGWAAIGNDKRTFKKEELKVHVMDAARPATNGVSVDGSNGANIILALSPFSTSLKFLAQLSKASAGAPVAVLAPVNQALYELKGFRITKLEVVVTPGGMTGKQLEQSRASARMLGKCFDEIAKFALKYYVGRLVPGDRTFEGQKGYGRKLIEKTTGKLLPNFQEGFEQIVDGISEAELSFRGASIHSKITYEVERLFLNAVTYWSEQSCFETFPGPLSGDVWPFKSTQEAIDRASKWEDSYYDALVVQLDRILPYE
jgi:hypothetical protein